ncbi:MAG: VanZ family protein, partial [Planctomycetes bacterium]|nr:VanZ family protein [Planctomycetota bacterium]
MLDCWRMATSGVAWNQHSLRSVLTRTDELPALTWVGYARDVQTGPDIIRPSRDGETPVGPFRDGEPGVQRFLDTGGGFATAVGKSNQENRTLLPRSCFSSRTRFPRTGLEVPALAVVLVFVILGSLTPFQLDFQLNGWLGLSDSPLFWPKTNPVDAAVNVVVYAFVGAGLFALLRNRFEVPGAAVLTILCSVSLSLALETTQLIIKGRYASLWDVCFNAIGAVVGAVLIGLFYRKIV